MRVIRSATALLALSSAVSMPALSQGKPFEGTITFEAGGGRNGSGAFSYSIKGQRVRFEPRGSEMQMVMLMDLDAKVMRMVVPGQNMYMEMELPDAEDDGKDLRKDALVNTGRTDDVAGRKCEIWTMKDEGREYEACVARDMGTFMQGSSPMGRRSAPPAWQAELRKGGFFPLRVVEKGGSGRPMLVATKIEEKSLDDAMFAVPAGAQKMTMPPGMGGRRP